LVSVVGLGHRSDVVGPMSLAGLRWSDTLTGHRALIQLSSFRCRLASDAFIDATHADPTNGELIKGRMDQLPS
jgi:hypothetical protein